MGVSTIFAVFSPSDRSTLRGADHRAVCPLQATQQAWACATCKTQWGYRRTEISSTATAYRLRAACPKTFGLVWGLMDPNQSTFETQGKRSAPRQTAYRLRAAPPKTFGLVPSKTPLPGGMGAHGFTQIPQNQRRLQIASHEVWGNI